MNIPLNIDWQQILLHLFNFVILGTGLYLLLYQPVKAFMEKRNDLYAQREQETSEKLQEAQRFHDDCEERLNYVDHQIAKKQMDAAREMEEYRARETARAKREADAILEQARQKAEREREKMLADAQGEITDAAFAMAEKIVQTNISKERQSELLDDLLRKAGERSA